VNDHLAANHRAAINVLLNAHVALTEFVCLVACFNQISLAGQGHERLQKARGLTSLLSLAKFATLENSFTLTHDKGRLVTNAGRLLGSTIVLTKTGQRETQQQYA
jgi:hypothetical protein